ncbi:MAG TPA: hypothetical protein VGQ57_11065 [Polyangiaceae bacterium]|jgi:hypothetical protein|nr:hypothetical protein [Polyangiaceae bacterium]
MNAFLRAVSATACIGLGISACGGSDKQPSGGSSGNGGTTGGTSAVAGKGGSGTGGSSAGSGGQLGQGGSGATGGTTGGTAGGVGPKGGSGGSAMAGNATGATGPIGTGGATPGGMGGVGGALGGAGSGGNGACGATACDVFMGGSAGAAGSGGDGAGGSAGMASPCDIGGKILCDDFESYTAGTTPMAAPWAPQNCFDTMHTLKVDTALHHAGDKALVGGDIPYADCQIHADLGASLSEYWVRAWVQYQTAAPTASTHEVSVFELVPQAGTDDPSIRIGYRGDTCMPIGVELNITGGGQEETGCTGSVPMPNTWYCYVLHVRQMSSSVTATLSIDGVAQTYKNHGADQLEITSQVTGIRYLRLGPRSYSGNFATPIWVDDVAVATQELKCN